MGILDRLFGSGSDNQSARLWTSTRAKYLKTAIERCESCATELEAALARDEGSCDSRTIEKRRLAVTLARQFALSGVIAPVLVIDQLMKRADNEATYLNRWFSIQEPLTLIAVFGVFQGGFVRRAVRWLEDSNAEALDKNLPGEVRMAIRVQLEVFQLTADILLEKLLPRIHGSVFDPGRLRRSTAVGLDTVEAGKGEQVSQEILLSLAKLTGLDTSDEEVTVRWMAFEHLMFVELYDMVFALHPHEFDCKVASLLRG